MGTCGPAYGRTLVDKHVGGKQSFTKTTLMDKHMVSFTITTLMDKFMGDFAKHHQPYEPAYAWDTKLCKHHPYGQEYG